MTGSSCLCGAITRDSGGPLERMLHCRCSRCRKARGAHAANLGVRPRQLRCTR